MLRLLKRVSRKIGELYVLYFESLLYKNWFNPLVTIYLNFRSFPISQAWHLPVFVYGWPKMFSLYGSMYCQGTCKTGMVTLNKTLVGMPNHSGVATEINKWGKIIFHGSCQIYTFNHINVSRTGVLELGEGTKIMCMVNITAHQSVRIGAQSWIVHRCQVMDSNFHYIADFRKGRINRYFRPIVIGKYCWVCNSTTVAAGAIIPNKTIVASNSLVNKDMSDIPEESIIGGQPAKLISTGFRKVESKMLESRVCNFFLENPDALYYPLPDDASHAICDVDI